MTRFVLLALVLSLNAQAVYNVGDKVENMCWKDADAKSHCLDDYKDTVRVLLYNAGWCGPCNNEMDEIVQNISEIDGKPANLFSLSASGWQNGSQPTPQFLREWTKRHNIPFVVLGSPKDAGKSFFAPPLYIPNVAVIDAQGNLSYKAVNPGASKIFAEVKKLIP